MVGENSKLDGKGWGCVVGGYGRVRGGRVTILKIHCMKFLKYYHKFLKEL